MFPRFFPQMHHELLCRILATTNRHGWQIKEAYLGTSTTINHLRCARGKENFVGRCIFIHFCMTTYFPAVFLPHILIIPDHNTNVFASGSIFCFFYRNSRPPLSIYQTPTASRVLLYVNPRPRNIVRQLPLHLFDVRFLQNAKHSRNDAKDNEMNTPRS